MLKTISLTIAMVMLSAGVAFAAIPADVPGTIYEEAILALIEEGAITGDTDGLFHPTDSLTRAQACVIIVKTINPPSAEVVGTTTQKVPESGFTDLKGYKWAEGYISYAVKNGIVKGYPDGTFKPGNNVTSNEMLTMVLRAAGYTEDQIGPAWPEDYIAKAEEVGITEGITSLPNIATKEIAAQMTYNKLDALKEKGEGEGPVDKPEVGILPKLTYATGKFNDTMTTYAGTPISADVVVYTYGLKANYKSNMTLPEKESEMRLDTVQKFKLAETPCFYQKEGGEITFMVLPMDAGFSGRIYGVINSSSKVVNGKGDTVNYIYTLAAAQSVAWFTADEATEAPDSAEYLAGEVYELSASNGTIKAISTADSGKGNKNFIELTAGSTWNTVKNFADGNVTLENDGMFGVANNATVYVLSDDGKSYKVGRQSDIRKDASIRAYSISEDEEVASIITIKKN